ncbi:MAG: DoxX protein [Bdellovibrionota bacterium]|nr:MAG: DoxX protein [Pseudomonadota bacterium]
MKSNPQIFVIYFLRLALSASFLSAVADRFGFWGVAGAPGVAWGNFDSFTAYTGTLIPLAPMAVIPAMAWLATVLEVILGLLLIVGFRIRDVALLSGLLLLVFALSMTFTLGIKAPLDYSVYSASAAAFALYVLLPTKPRRRN